MRVWFFFVVLMVFAANSFAATSHGTTDPTAELYASIGDTAIPFIVSQSCLPAVPGGGGSLTFGSFSCSLYARDSTLTVPRMFYITQPSIGLGPLNAGDGTYWFGMHRDVSTALGGWTRQTGTHYLWQKNASQPANPAGGLVAAQITVSGGKITAIVPTVSSSSTRSPAMGILYAADYGVICDGATETSGTLQRAINLAAANNVALQLPGGTCVIRTGMTVPTKSRIMGAPNGELYWDTPVAGTNVVLLATDASEVIIEGVRIRSTNTTATFNATFQDNISIEFDHTSNSIVRNCHIQDFWGIGAIVLGPGATSTNHSDNNLIEGNIFLRGYLYGVEIASGNNNRVTANYFEDTAVGFNQAANNQTRFNAFTNNIIVGVLQSDLVVSLGGLGTETNNVFSGNLLSNARISATPTFTFGLIEGNVITSSTSSSTSGGPIGIIAGGASVIKGNSLNAINWTGAYAAGLGAVYCTSCGDMVIEGNLIENAVNGNGLGLNGNTKSIVRGNLIVFNGANGIEVSGQNFDVVIDGNDIYDNNPGNNAAYYGVNLNGTVPLPATRTMVTGNRIYSPGSNKQRIPFIGTNDVDTWLMGNRLYPRQSSSAWTIASSITPHYWMNKLSSDSPCGTFTLSASNGKTVTNGNAISGRITLTPNNSSAGTLMGSAKSLYVSTFVSFTSFTVATADGTNAAGTELFAYCILGN